MAKTLRLKNAEKVRLYTTQQQQKDIKKLYEDLYTDVSKQISSFGKKGMTLQQLIVLKRDIGIRISQLNNDIKNGIVRNMRTVSNQVVIDTQSFLRLCGFKNADDAFMYIPDQIVRNILTGNIYDGSWTLSKAIWGYNSKTQDTLSKIISYNTAQGKSAYETAKDIEAYVDPSSSKKSRVIKSWRLDNDGNRVADSFYFGKVDYNAQRLARTMVSHAYQQSFMSVNENDPFVIGYRWITSNFHGRVCPVCEDYATRDSYGLGSGVFPKDELPIDHPNGMCTFDAVMSHDMSHIAKKIGEWYNSPVGTFPDIDKYAADFVK